MDRQNNQTTPNVLKRLRKLEPYRFEEFVGELWSMKGWETEVTSQSGDKGIDVIATKSFPYNKKSIIQAKRHSKNNSVSGPSMQKYASLKQRDNVDEVVVISTSDFTAQAEEISDEFNIKLVNGSRLDTLVTELSAERLVDSYTGDDIEFETDSKEVEIDENEDFTADKRAIGECDLLRLELLGYEYVSKNTHDIPRQGDMEGYVLAFELTNTFENKLCLHEWDIIDVIAENSYSYSPEKKFCKDRRLPGQWQAQLPEAPSQSKAKFVCYVPSKSEFEISKISLSDKLQKFLHTSVHFEYIEENPRLLTENRSLEIYVRDDKQLSKLPGEISSLF